MQDQEQQRAEPEHRITQSQADLLTLRLTMQRLERAVDHLTATMDSTYARKDVVDPRFQELEKDVQSLLDWKDWAIRIVLGLVIAGLVTMLLAQRVMP